jgi:SPOR domain
MVDDSNFRSHRRNDPLAELARLIGQNEPFSDLNRGTPGPSPAQSRPAPASMPKAPMLGAAASSQSDPYGSPLQPGGRQFGYPEPQHRDFPPAYDPAIYGTRQQEQAPAYPSETSFDDPARAPHGEEAFEEDYGEGRARRGVKIALVLAGLAIIGTSGVLGYRVVFGGAPSGPPPVIKANTTPSKIVPEAAAEASNKQIYDRVGDTSESERVVPREEKPVEVKDSSRSPARMTSPSLPASSGTQEMAMKDNSRPPARATSSSYPASSGAQDMAMGASPPLNTDPGGPASAEPRKIRTVTIRPDQAGSNNGTGSIPAPRPSSTPPAARAAAAAPVAPAVAPAPTPLQAAPRAASGNAPVSLSPVASADASARPAFPTPAAAPSPAAATRLAAVPPAAQATSGAYSVQISSQRSESEAQASFRSLQAKFPNQLGDREPIIRRADLGKKGIYFRTMVGPFASVDQATQFCGSLKSAGGQCVVQRN